MQFHKHTHWEKHLPALSCPPTFPKGHSQQEQVPPAIHLPKIEFWTITGNVMENIFQNHAHTFHRNRFCFYLCRIQIRSVFVLRTSVIYWHAASHKIFAYMESNCSDTFRVCQEENASVQCNRAFKQGQTPGQMAAQLTYQWRASC